MVLPSSGLLIFLSLTAVEAAIPSRRVEVFPAPRADALDAQLGLFQRSLGSHVDAVFFDIDETLVMPAAPFIYGLPRTDMFVKAFTQTCTGQTWQRISDELGRLYYSSPHFLVSPTLPSMLAKMQAAGVHVVALTSRSAAENGTSDLLGDLQRLGLSLSSAWFEGPLKPDGAVARNTSVGAVIFGNSQNKGDIIASYVEHAPGKNASSTVLVDNTHSKCKAAAEALLNATFIHRSIHYTEAYNLDGQHDDMDFWMRTVKTGLSIPEAECPLPTGTPVLDLYV